MRVALCDDHRILIEALGHFLTARGHEVVAIAVTVADGISAVVATQPDVCLLDLHFPGTKNGLDVAREIREGAANTKILVLSGINDRTTISATMEIGISGFIRKDQGAGRIADALEFVGAGGTVFDPWPSAPVEPPAAGRRKLASWELTPREREVLSRIVNGQSTEQMAREMEISTSSLRTYVKIVLSKLGVHTRLQAAAFASRSGLVSDFHSA